MELGRVRAVGKVSQAADGEVSALARPPRVGDDGQLQAEVRQGTLEMPTTYAELHDLDLAIVALRLRLAQASLFVEVWDRDPNHRFPPSPATSTRADGA